MLPEITAELVELKAKQKLVRREPATVSCNSILKAIKDVLWRYEWKIDGAMGVPSDDHCGAINKPRDPEYLIIATCPLTLMIPKGHIV